MNLACKNPVVIFHVIQPVIEKSAI